MRFYIYFSRYYMYDTTRHVRRVLLHSIFTAHKKISRKFYVAREGSVIYASRLFRYCQMGSGRNSIVECLFNVLK